MMTADPGPHGPGPVAGDHRCRPVAPGAEDPGPAQRSPGHQRRHLPGSDQAGGEAPPLSAAAAGAGAAESSARRARARFTGCCAAASAASRSLLRLRAAETEAACPPTSATRSRQGRLRRRVYQPGQRGRGPGGRCHPGRARPQLQASESADATVDSRPPAGGPSATRPRPACSRPASGAVRGAIDADTFDVMYGPAKAAFDCPRRAWPPCRRMWCCPRSRMCWSGGRHSRWPSSGPWSSD